MEDHFVPKHREVISAASPLCRNAGFTHFAAEAIGEFWASLTSRGYPVVETGYYISDPQIGNTLWLGIYLELEVLGNGFRPFTHERRVEVAASVHSKLFKGNSQHSSANCFSFLSYTGSTFAA